jgi:hypothetical protein
MNSSEAPASQPQNKTMGLIARLYANREKFPMQAEPKEMPASEPQE